MEHSLYQDWQAFNDLLAHIPEERRKANERECTAIVMRVRIEAACRLFATPWIRRQWMLDQIQFYLDYPNGITIGEV